jgi:heptosyltransferase-2
VLGRRRSGAVVIQAAYMGDVVLTTSLLAVLAGRHGPVDVVTTPSSAPLLEPHPAVRAVIRYDKRGADAGWRGVRRIAAELRARRYAAAYLPHRSWRSASLAFAARVPERVGFSDSPAATFYTRKVTRPMLGHESARIAALAAADGAAPAAPPAPPPTLGVNRVDRLDAERWLAAHGVAGGYVAMAPGSIWGAKRWPHFPALASALDRPIVVIGGGSDVALGDTVTAAAPDRARSAAGVVGPRVSAALIERAEAVVTNEAAALHLATAVGTPVVALFGPTVPGYGFGPIGPLDVTLGLDELLCRPCAPSGHQAVCPLDHHRCLDGLSVATVVDALESVVRRARERRSEGAACST